MRAEHLLHADVFANFMQHQATGLVSGDVLGNHDDPAIRGRHGLGVGRMRAIGQVVHLVDNPDASGVHQVVGGLAERFAQGFLQVLAGSRANDVATGVPGNQLGRIVVEHNVVKRSVVRAPVTTTAGSAIEEAQTGNASLLQHD